MLRPLDRLGRTIRERDEDDPVEPSGFAPLRVLTAQLLLMTAAEAAFAVLRQPRDVQPLDYPSRAANPSSTLAALAPSLLAPLAATAHLLHLSSPSRATELTTRLLDTAVVGVGVGAAIAGIVARRGGQPARATAPLALATAGVLGLVLDRQERQHVREHDRLARRASVIERLLPARKPHLDHFVVHV